MPVTKEQIDAADRLAVKIVTLVCKRLYNGKLYAYDGVEAAREIRSMILRLATSAAFTPDKRREET